MGRRPRGKLGAGGVVATLLACLCFMAAAPRRADAAGADDFAGAHVTDGYDTDTPERRAAAYVRQADSGLRLARVWFEWSAIETQPGRFDFSLYDAVVADAARAGLRLLPVLIDPPGFRSSAPPGPQAGTYPPADPAAMADFASVVVGRYGRDGAFWDAHPELPRLPVRSWQIWNEPNIWPWWGSGPDPAAYTRLARVVGTGIHRCDPEAEIVAAGLPNGNAAGMQADPYAKGMYDAGAADVFDTIALHPYGRTARDVIAQVESLRAVVSAAGDTAPIWVTEFGWGTGGPATILTVSADRQADLAAATVGELHARRASLGVRGVVYYQWADGLPGGANDDSVWFHVGLVTTARTAKPALTRLTSTVQSLGLGPVRPDPPTGVKLGGPCRLTPERTAPPAVNAMGDGRAGEGGSGGANVHGGGGAASTGASRTPAPSLSAVKLTPTRFRAAADGPAVRP